MILYILFIFMVSCSQPVNPDTPMPNTSTTENPLINDVKKNRIEAVEQALKKGADVNTRDSKGRTLLLLATHDALNDMAALLVKYGADVNRQDDIKDSPFLYAGATGQTQLVKLFLENGAKFNVFNRYNGTALIPACERGHVETVKLLANTRNFPIDHVNRLGWTALMEAVVLGNGSEKYQQIVRILKEAGCNLNIPDNDGKTALQHARASGYKEIVRILESE
ncbi:ankyrin repeat domain-containing protein [Ravibacter arvi]|uniref:Ankyrin repeat domain-containing protein n=1 Tax=Ravibacter arvi TaxID=2051041 RepID=A0ABP8LTY9_9BACT